MERADWLKHEREKAEKLYDLYAPEGWDLSPEAAEATHQVYLQKFLELIPPRSRLLSAGCGMGRYDGLLLNTDHDFMGIDQSEGMLTQARKYYPEARYEKIGLQEMDFRDEFDGITCIDDLEYVCPEDWSKVMDGFRNALKPGGVLYFTTPVMTEENLEMQLEQAKAKGLPAVIGEIVYLCEGDYERDLKRGKKVTAEEYTLYNYNPPLEQVREWIQESGLAIEEEGNGKQDDAYNGKIRWWYEHFIVRKK